MALKITPDPVPLRIDSHGVLRICNTRIPIDTVVSSFIKGHNPEDISNDFPTLQLADIYTVIGYYLRHRADVDAYLREREQRAAEIRSEVETRFPRDGVRERLLARGNRKNQAHS